MLQFSARPFATLLTICMSFSPAFAQYGAKTAKPYTQADIDYGRKEQARIDSQRSEYAAAKIEKQAAEPFHIVGDLYWVGIHNWGSALIKTSEGLILIDTSWNETAPLVAADIEKLGFKLTDVKIILMTEYHGDHNAGVAYFKEKTGAKVMVMGPDAPLVEKGGNNYPPAKVDRVLKDRDTVKLGNKTLTAYFIPGHTPGSTTWYWQETENGVTYNVADVCCWFTPNNVVTDPENPTEQLRKNWQVLKSLPVDIPFPGIHAYHFDTWTKYDRMKKGEKMPWIDPQGYRGVIAAFEQDFEDKVKQQLKDGPPPPRQGRGGPPPVR